MEQMIQLSCGFCGSQVFKRLAHYNYTQKISRSPNFFCGNSCRKSYEKRKAQESFIDRFWAKVNKAPGLGPEGTCWEWIGNSKSMGYGAMKVDQKPRLSHQISWFLHYGNWSSREKFILHSCDNRLCVNPAHLREGTLQENSQDMVDRNRAAKGENNGNSSLTPTKVKTIRALYKVNSAVYSAKYLGKLFNIYPSTVHRLINRRLWKHI